MSATRALPFLLLAACTSANEPVKLTPSQAADSAHAAHSTSATAATARPTATDPAPAVARPAPPASAGSMQFQVPEGWIVETPTSSMRKAQFKLPKESGDPEDAQLVLFYFGGEGGSKQENLKRWAGQFVQPDGRDSIDVLQTSTRAVNGLAVTEASISGTYDSEMMPGSGQRVRNENWSMLAAIVETPSGPYYAKLTGPAATVGRWEPGFRQWISSLKHVP